MIYKHVLNVSKSKVPFIIHNAPGEGEGDAAAEITLDNPVVAGLIKDAITKYEENEVAGIKKSRDNVLLEKKQLSDQLDKFKGFDPEEYATLKAAQAKTEEDKAKAAGDFESLKTQLVEKHTGELTEKDTRVDFLLGQLKKHLIDAKLMEAITKANGNPKLLIHEMNKHVKTFEENDDFIAKVINLADGSPRINSGKGDAMTFDELVEEFRKNEDYGMAFKADGSGGSGVTKTTVPGNKTLGGVISISKVDARNVELYRQAKEKAKKEGKRVEILA